MKFFDKISLKLLAAIVLVFVLQQFVPGLTELLYFNPKAPNLWMFVSSIFLHGSIMHLFFNGFALLMFGPYLEAKIGSRNFLAMFLATGIFGNLLYFAAAIIGIIPLTPALGASGAIYGILGMLAMIEPGLVIFFFFFPMPIRTAAIFWIVLEFLNTFNPASGIGSAAHLGGLLFGLALGYYYKNRFPSKPKDENDDAAWENIAREENWEN